MIFEYCMRPMPKTWWKAVLCAPYRFFEMLFLALLVAIPCFYFVILLSIVELILRKTLAVRPSRKLVKIWLKVRVSANSVYRFSLMENIDYFSGNDIKKLTLKSQSVIPYLLSEAHAVAKLDEFLEAILENLRISEYGEDCKRLPTKKQQMILDSISVCKDEIAESIVSAPVDVEETKTGIYRYDTPYMRYLSCYYNLSKMFDSVKESEIKESWKELYNAIYRPTLHMVLEAEDAETFRLPVYYPQYDVLEGQLYEFTLRKGSIAQYVRDHKEEVLNYSIKKHPELEGLPDEWVMKVAETSLAEAVENYRDGKVWTSNDFSEKMIPKWGILLSTNMYWKEIVGIFDDY